MYALCHVFPLMPGVAVADFLSADKRHKELDGPQIMLVQLRVLAQTATQSSSEAV